MNVTYKVNDKIIKGVYNNLHGIKVQTRLYFQTAFLERLNYVIKKELNFVRKHPLISTVRFSHNRIFDLKYLESQLDRVAEFIANPSCETDYQVEKYIQIGCEYVARFLKQEPAFTIDDVQFKLQDGFTLTYAETVGEWFWEFHKILNVMPDYITLDNKQFSFQSFPLIHVLTALAIEKTAWGEYVGEEE